jgi:hypothetical protein
MKLKAEYSIDLAQPAFCYLMPRETWKVNIKSDGRQIDCEDVN